jgi:hypothetical protein
MWAWMQLFTMLLLLLWPLELIRREHRLFDNMQQCSKRWKKGMVDAKWIHATIMLRSVLEKEESLRMSSLRSLALASVVSNLGFWGVASCFLCGLFCNNVFAPSMASFGHYGFPFCCRNDNVGWMDTYTWVKQLSKWFSASVFSSGSYCTLYISCLLQSHVQPRLIQVPWALLQKQLQCLQACNRK